MAITDLTIPGEELTDEQVGAWLEAHKDDPVDAEQVERVRRRVEESLTAVRYVDGWEGERF
jgi:hypothetical protein